MKKLFWLPLVLGMALTACKKGVGPVTLPQESKIFGLASLITLNREETTLYLEDYFYSDVSLDSIGCPTGLDCALDPDLGTISLTKNTESLSNLSELKLWVDGDLHSILLRKSRKVMHTFRLADPGKSMGSVKIKANFNEWNPENTILNHQNGNWTANLSLDPGTYQYLYVIDDKETLDPANPDSTSNGMGGYNSELVVKTGDGGPPPRLTATGREEGHIYFKAENADEVFVMWENFRLKMPYVRETDGEYKVVIPEQAKSKARSYFRIYAQNNSGVSNDLFIPLIEGKIVRETKDLARTDKHMQILYFLMVDRFHNGNPDNDDPLKDSRVHEKANYWGGDLKGVTEKIKGGMFKELGINTLWLSPITQNPLEAFKEYPAPHRMYSGYHGYWPISSSKVDHRFGTSDDLTELITTAHSNGINVLLDYVCNHVHEQHPLYQAHPEWATQLDLPDGRKNIRIWDEQRLTTWFDTFLPSLDFSKQEVIDMQVDSCLFWVKNYELDGFRHDATKHVPTKFWRTLTRRLNQEVVIEKGRPVYQVGETFGSRELIGSYVGSGQMDGQFDFNLYFDARGVLAKDEGSFEDLSRSLNESMEFYGYHNLMGNISGNHDLPRFISYAGGALDWDEDAKEAGWKRNLKMTSARGYKKLGLLQAFILTIPGIPVIYYGDEYGQLGAGDPDNRRPMRFKDYFNEEYRLLLDVQKLIHLRKFHLPLIYGDLEILHQSDSTFAYARSWFNEVAIVAMNKDTVDVDLEIELPERFSGLSLKANFGGKPKTEGNRLTLKLKGESFDVMLGKARNTKK